MWMWLIIAAAGVCAALLVWLCLSALHAVPAESRLSLRAHLPLWWRILWPLAAAGAWYGRPLLTWGARRGLEQRLRQAGLHRLLTPEQVLGAQLAAATVAGGWGVFAIWALGGSVALRGGTPLVILGVAALAAWLPRLWLRDQIGARRLQVLRALPFVLDMTTLCVEGGLNLHGALQQAVDKGPEGPLRDELRGVLGDMRAGMSRAEALRQMAQRLDEPAVRVWVAALVQAEALGMNLGPILRAQADQRRSERFLLAEKLALQAPVKMLLPLIVFIFPCTFIVIAFPIAIKLLELTV